MKTKVLATIGAAGWLSAAQFFVLETVAERAWTLPYSRLDNYISDLGARTCGLYDSREVCSPLHAVMNSSFILTGVGLSMGAGLLRTENALVRWLSAAAAVGVITVGLVPEDVGSPLHAGGAVVYFVAGNIALIVLGASWREKRALAASLIGLGAIGLIALILLGTKNTGGLGEGGMERLAGYPISAGFTLAGAVLISRLRNRRVDRITR